MKTIWTSFDKRQFLNKVEEYQKALGKFRLDQQSVIYYLVHQSTAMEGSTLTQIEAEHLVRHGMKTGRDTQSEAMVKNYSDGLFQMLYWTRQKQTIGFKQLQELNHLVMKDNGLLRQLNTGEMINTALGDLRHDLVYRGRQHQFPPAERMKTELSHYLKRWAEVLQRPKNIISAYQIAFEMHYHVLRCHPFWDGNSRTSRLLQNFVEKWYRVPLSTVLVSQKALYKQTLLSAWTLNEPKMFINYMYHQTLLFFDFVQRELDIHPEQIKEKQNTTSSLIP